MALPLLQPRWPATKGVGAAMSLRAGGASRAPWDSLNLGLAVGDDGLAVAANRRRFAAAIAAQPVWLRQVHGTTVLQLRQGTGAGESEPASTAADAAWTAERGLACVVQVADCLPVLFASADGSGVAAAHAGWRGLAGGVLEATVQALCRGTGTVPADLRVWLGPCIGPRQFEVGAEVLQAFGRTPGEMQQGPFVHRRRADGASRWLADLPQLARERLAAAGVVDVSAEGACTVEEASRFFSFRRDGVTGRMAAAIWRL